MLHGFADTGDIGAPARQNSKKPYRRRAGLRGMGPLALPTPATRKRTRPSTHRCDGYLRIEKADLVTQDIGNMVGYAWRPISERALFKWVVIDAPLPGLVIGEDQTNAIAVAFQLPRTR